MMNQGLLIYEEAVMKQKSALGEQALRLCPRHRTVTIIGEL